MAARSRLALARGAVAVALACLLGARPGAAVPLPAWSPPDGRALAPLSERPADARLLGCSARRPVCVHARPPAPSVATKKPGRAPKPNAPPGRETVWLQLTLAAAERAMDGLLALGLPWPPNDAPHGGSGAFDLVLDPGVTQALVVPDPPEPLAWPSRDTAFGVLAPPGPGASCDFELAVARVLAEGLLLGLDPTVGDGILGMQSSYLARLAAPCVAAEADAIDRAQRAPERALASWPRGALAGSLLFPWYLDDGFGRDSRGGVMTALLCLGATHASPEAGLPVDEPDAFDALRRAAADRERTLDDLLLDFAVARAFVGARSDGAHLEATELFGDFGRVRFEWLIPFDSLPRRLGPGRRLEPTGASYLWLDRPVPEAVGGVLAHAVWESGLVLRWALVKVDAQGQELGRVIDAGTYGRHEAQLTIDDLTGVAGVLVVVTYVGSDDRSHPYDPDDPVAELADYQLTLHRSDLL